MEAITENHPPPSPPPLPKISFVSKFLDFCHLLQFRDERGKLHFDDGLVTAKSIAHRSFQVYNIKPKILLSVVGYSSHVHDLEDQ